MRVMSSSTRIFRGAAAVMMARGCTATMAAGAPRMLTTLPPASTGCIVRFGASDGRTVTGRVVTDAGGPPEVETAAGDRVRVEMDRLLPPFVPTAIYCIGLNYKAHAMESGLQVDASKYPLHFLKPPSCVLGSGGVIRIPSVAAGVPEVDYEGELGIVINTPCKNVTKGEALNYVGYLTVCNDVSARRWQKKAGGQFSRAKSFDTFCPFGPALVPLSSVKNPRDLGLRTTLNGKLMQNSRTTDMIFGIDTIIEYLSQGTTLEPGTLILTGTPSGVGFARTPPVFLAPGDIVEVSIEGLGTLSNTVGLESPQHS